MNELDIVVFDFETGGLDPNYHEAIQVAGKAYNARTLEPYPVEQGGEFSSLMKPRYPERLSDDALRVNKKTREELEGAPDQKIVWGRFIDWVNKWNRTKSQWGAPIAAGKNIRNFDMKFVDALNNAHFKRKKSLVLFSNRIQLDLEDIIFMWFENEAEPKKRNMDALREFFGMASDNAHDALEDCRQTGMLITRFLKVHRELQRRKTIKFREAFK